MLGWTTAFFSLGLILPQYWGNITCPLSVALLRNMKYFFPFMTSRDYSLWSFQLLFSPGGGVVSSDTCTHHCSVGASRGFSVDFQSSLCVIFSLQLCPVNLSCVRHSKLQALPLNLGRMPCNAWVPPSYTAAWKLQEVI